MLGIKQTDSKSNTWMMFNTDGNKTLCNKNAQDMAIVTEEQVRYGQQAVMEK